MDMAAAYIVGLPLAKGLIAAAVERENAVMQAVAVGLSLEDAARAVDHFRRVTPWDYQRVARHIAHELAVGRPLEVPGV